MAEQIKKDDFAEADALANVIPTSEQIGMLQKMDDLLTSIAKKMKEKMTSFSSDSFKDISEEAKAQENLNKAYEQAVSVNKQLKNAQKQANEEQEKAVKLAKETDDSWRKQTSSMRENAENLMRLKENFASIGREIKLYTNILNHADKGTKNYDKWNEKIIELTLQQNVLKQQISDTNIELKAQTKEFLAADGSMDKLNQTLGLMRNLWRAMTDEEKNSPLGENLLKQIKELDKSLKQADGQIGNFQRNVGNYAEGFKTAFSEFGNFSSGANGLISTFGDLNSSAGGFINTLSSGVSSIFSFGKGTLSLSKGLSAVGMGSKTASTGMKAFRIALISTGIGAIVVALGSLVAYLTKTTEGSNKLTKMLAPLKAIFGTITTLAVEFGEKIFKAFENPKQAVKDLWETIKTNIVNRIAGLGKIFESIGKIIKSGFTDGFKDFGNAVLQANTGVENLVDKLIEGGKAVSEIYKEQKKLQDLIAEQTIIASEFEVTYELNLSRLERQREEQALIAKEAGFNSEKGKRALKEAIRLEEERFALTKSKLIIDKNIAEAQGRANAVNGEIQRADRLAINLIQKDIEQAEAQSLRIIKRLTTRENSEKALTKEQINQNKLREAELKDSIELLEIETELLKAGRLTEKAQEDIAYIYRLQLMDRLKLLESMNEENQFAKEIAEIRRKLAFENRKDIEDEEERLKIEREKTAELMKQYDALVLQGKLDDISFEISKLDKDGKDYNAKLKALYQQRYDLRKEALEKEKALTLSSLEEGSQEYINKELEFNNKLKKLRQDFQTENDNIDVAEKYKLDVAEIEKQITDSIEKQIDKRIALLDKESEARKKQIGYLEELAKNGNITTQDSLKQQIEAERELEKERLKLEKRKANLQMISSGLQIFTKEIEDGKSAGVALGNTITQMKMLEQVLAGLNFFYSGTDNAPGGLAVVDELGAEIHTDKRGNIKSFGQNKGARFTMTERGDKIYTAKQTKEMLANLNTSTYGNKPQLEQSKDISNYLVISELQKINKELANRDSIITEFDSLTKTIIQSQKSKKVRTIKKYRL